MEETQILPCMVCQEPVEVAVDFPDGEAVLCIIHYFNEDVTEAWEREEDE